MAKKVYQNAFSYNTDISKNAYMNWRMDSAYPIHNFAVMAKGYMDVALSLANECLADNSDKKADKLIFPILFNADQSIELYLKSIMWELNLLENTGKSFDSGHDLKQILGTVKSLIRYHCNQEDQIESKKRLSNVEEYIDELYLMLHPDTNGCSKGRENLDFPRYPVNKDKDPFTNAEITSKNVTVDLVNFVDRFSKISADLGEAYDYFEGQLLSLEGKE